MLRHSLRGCADWRSEGLSIRSTTSDEATKLYDCAITQFSGLYDNQNYGGIGKTLDDMIRADPDFVLGQSLVLGLNLSGITQEIDPELKKKVTDLSDKVKKNRDSYEEREVKHVEALTYLTEFDIKGATRVWEEILSEHPTDIHALNMAYGLYFNNGMPTQLRDSVARVLPHWTGKRLPLESYLHGMLAFGLEETNLFAKAELEANLALQMDECDGWATHAISHIDETLGRAERGIRFLTESEQNWTKSNFIACHNYWHLALHHLSREEWEPAIKVFDDQVLRRAEASGGKVGHLVDATQLLFRLDWAQPDPELVGQQRWDRVYAMAEPQINAKYRLGFFDAHLLLASIGSKHTQSVEEIADKVLSYEGSDQWLKTSRTIIRALVEYNRENYGKCVDLLFDIKYETQCLGGSNAQRDVFNKIMICAALKSPKEWHKMFALNMINENNLFD